MEKAGLIMHGGTIADAAIINAPISTKNKNGKRDPEMHQTKKGNQWYHGMKIHSGVDAGSGCVLSIIATAVNVHDIGEAAKLIHEDNEVMYRDSGYRCTVCRRGHGNARKGWADRRILRGVVRLKRGRSLKISTRSVTITVISKIYPVSERIMTLTEL